MKIVYSPAHDRHDAGSEFNGVSLIPGYEVPRRATLVHAALTERRIGTFVPPRPFGLNPILAVHERGLLDFLREAFRDFRAKHGPDVREAYPSSWPARRLRQVPGIDVDGRFGFFCFDTATPIVAGTYEAALNAVDCALTAASMVQSGDRAAFALCRPPGHHAASDLYGGYCFFNNAAIAAQWLTSQGSRVAILDVDYHHGNGTQEIFFARADVLAVSIHADPAYAYPHFSGYADEIGEGAGEGYNLNLPLSYGTDWAGYWPAFQKAAARLSAFGPDVIVVALGLDTYERDPISKFKLAAADYFRLGEAIAGLRRPVLFTMEGGYDLRDLGTITANVLEGFQNGAH